MDISDALILGLVQGFTEFLPVSSSGHLVIARHLIGGFREPGILFEVLLHLGTLLAVLLYFRRELRTILVSMLPAKGGEGPERVAGRKRAVSVVAGTVPTVVIALLFKDQFEALFDNVQAVSVMLLVTGLLLFLSDRIKGANKGEVGLKEALIIGTVQGMAIIPGISRSGSTIAAGIMQGVERERAAAFSFLLAIPAVMGAVVLHMKELDRVDAGLLLPYLVGMAAAAVTGFVSIKLLMKVVTGRHLRYFAFYCWGVGLTTLVSTLN